MKDDGQGEFMRRISISRLIVGTVTLGISIWTVAASSQSESDKPAVALDSTVAAAECDGLAWMAGLCGGETQYSQWLREVIDETRERRFVAEYPPEPKGLVVSGVNRKVSGAFNFSLSETAVAVAANNPKWIAAGANAVVGDGTFRQAMFVSQDGGRTFRSAILPPTIPQPFTFGDPTVAWTSDGAVWAGALEGQLVNDPTGVSLGLKGLSYRSVDRGATWTFAGSFSGNERLADRPTFWVDSSPNSAFRDSLYTTWHNGPVFVTRRRKGAAQWSAPVRVSPLDTQGFGGDLKIDSSGRLFVFWPDAIRKKIFVTTSNNGGVSFGPPIPVAAIERPLFQLIVPSAGNRAPSLYVTSAVLRSGGVSRAFIAWMDLAAPPATGARIWFSTSNNGGASWSAPREVKPTAAANVDQFHPSLVIDPTSRRLALAYTDNLADPSGRKTRRVAMTSNDLGNTWSAPFVISTAPSDVSTEPEQIHGDYQSMFALGPRLWTVWTDRRSAAASSVWLAELRMTANGLVRVPIEAEAVK